MLCSVGCYKIWCRQKLELCLANWTLLSLRREEHFPRIPLIQGWGKTIGTEKEATCSLEPSSLPAWISHLVTDLQLNEQNPTIIDCIGFCSYLLDITLCGNRLLYRNILSKFMSLLIIFPKIHHCKTHWQLRNLVNSVCLSKLIHSMKSRSN